MYSAAVEAGEYESYPLKELLLEMFWEFYLGIFWYWGHDTSKNFTNTSTVLDKSLSILDTVLKSGIINKGYDLFHFFIKNHLFHRMGVVQRAFDLNKKKRKLFENIKRRDRS